MDLTSFATYEVPVVVGICLCVGYVIHNAIPNGALNSYIPFIIAVLGIVINVWLNAGSITPAIVFAGMFSGLASTGMYEAFKQIVESESSSNTANDAKADTTK